MKFLPTATLAYHENAPQKKTVNLSKRPVAMFSAATKKFREDCGMSNPDIEALEFYAVNHYYSLVSKQFTRNEPMPKWAAGLCSAYSGILTQQGERLMHYMFSIITRECRHLHAPNSTLDKKFIELGGDEMREFIDLIRGSNEDKAVNNYMNAPPPVGAGAYVRSIEWAFDHGSWSSSYGGKPWGKIARTLGDFLHGQISLEMMVDTAYTLAHNNGPMFNKGMMYSMYSSGFKAILDVQRGGMVPELVKNKMKYSYVKSLDFPVLEKLTEIAYEHFDELGNDVDWQKVMDLGALGSYNHLIKAPQQSTPTPVKPKVPPKPAPTKVNVPQFHVFNGKAAKHVGYYDVYPRSKN